MKRLRTEFTFDAAHRLAGYPGKCSSIHGHTYRVILKLEFDEGGANKAPLFMDFKNFKGLLKDEIERWDHSLILYCADMYLNTLKTMIHPTGRLVILAMQPTAENMAYLLAIEAKKNYSKYMPLENLEGWEILSAGGKNISCTLTVTVFETPTNAATVTTTYIGEGTS